MIIGELFMAGAGIAVLILAAYVAMQPAGYAAALLIGIIGLFMLGAGVAGVNRHNDDEG